MIGWSADRHSLKTSSANLIIYKIQDLSSHRTFINIGYYELYYEGFVSIFMNEVWRLKWAPYLFRLDKDNAINFTIEDKHTLYWSKDTEYLASTRASFYIHTLAILGNMCIVMIDLPGRASLVSLSTSWWRFTALVCMFVLAVGWNGSHNSAQADYMINNGYIMTFITSQIPDVRKCRGSEGLTNVQNVHCLTINTFCLKRYQNISNFFGHRSNWRI